MANDWLIKWQDRSANHDQDVVEEAKTPEEAVAILRRLLSSGQSSSEDDEQPPFDVLFQGAAPELLLRHVRDIVVYESRCGRLIIRRGHSDHALTAELAVRT